MNIKMNHYLNQISYMTAMDERASKPNGDRRIGSGTKSGTNKDTVIISVEGQLFTAKQKTSDSEMGLIEITSDFDSFTRAVKSMNEPLPVDWTAIVDPYQTFTNLAKIESRLKQLADPTVSRNDEEMERIADEYAKSKIDILIEKKKAMLESGTAKSKSQEYAEYKTAYDAYHSENGESLIAMMTGDTKKAYSIYKDIIDGASISIEDEEFLMLYNRTMYVGAKGEHIRKTEELYNERNML
ncbi:MAG: hypothetical protein HFI47_02415 [Lachnospiraceae bacterium]|nr:hypothetical protein [Lachnospiraceae bacterium]